MAIKPQKRVVKAIEVEPETWVRIKAMSAKTGIKIKFLIDAALSNYVAAEGPALTSKREG